MPRALATSRSAHTGQRDLLITIERLVEGLSDSNYPTEAFGQPMQFWAYREYVTLEEQFRGNQLTATAMERWDIPYSEAMDPDDVDVTKKRRIVFKGRVRNIISAEVLPHDMGRSIILTTQSAVDGAV
jgi:head-tail adaptor